MYVTFGSLLQLSFIWLMVFVRRLWMHSTDNPRAGMFRCSHSKERAWLLWAMEKCLLGVVLSKPQELLKL